MADFTGIQAVTSTLRTLLTERMAEPVEQQKVTAANPDDDASDGPWVNIFLYRIVENAELKNQDLPGRGSPLSYGHPPLSLDLHYLITTGGLATDDTVSAQRVLGDVMLTLHDNPIIAKDDDVLDPTLANEVEMLKITLQPLSGEELSNIWTATTAPYRLSIAYRVTVVQLETQRPRPVARPVLEPPDAGPRVYAVPLDRPAIASVGVYHGDWETGDTPQPVPYARIGDTLAISGTSFLPGTRVLLGDVEATPNDDDSTASLLFVEVPDDPALQAGVQRLQLVRDVTIGSDADEDAQRAIPMLRSNVAAFVVVPTVVTISGTPDDPTLTITGDRLLADAGGTTVFVGDRVLTPREGATTTRLTVHTPALPTGDHAVRVRVNGVESLDAVTWTVPA